LPVDCIPHESVRPTAAHHAIAHHHRTMLGTPVAAVRVLAKKLAPPRHAIVHRRRMPECSPGLGTPLADLDDSAVAQIYILPYAGAAGMPASALVSGLGVAPAEASGVDLPIPTLSDIGAMGGGSGGDTGLPGLGGGSGSGGSESGGSGSGGGGGGGGGSPGAGSPVSGPASSGPGGTGGDTGPIIIGVPPGGGSGLSTLPTGVPEPGAWALMLIGLEPDSKVYPLARRLMASWMQARVMKVARVSARFS
jgi:hypothetical protein